MKYEVAEGFTVAALKDDVRRLLRLGYRPQGGIAGGLDRLVQAMVNDDDTAVEEEDY